MVTKPTRFVSDAQLRKRLGTKQSLSPEWQIIDLALQAYGFVGVSLYDTLGKDSVGTYYVMDPVS
jgi:hypothetical protein